MAIIGHLQGLTIKQCKLKSETLNSICPPGARVHDSGRSSGFILRSITISRRPLTHDEEM